MESIGLRSTRIRSLDRTLIAIPNGQLAEMRIESLTARDRMRLHCRMQLVSRTTVAQLRQIRDDFTAILRAHDKIWPDLINVHFVEIGESSFDIDIMAWFQTSSFIEFLEIRHGILLEFVQAVEAAGTSFRVPDSSAAREVALARTFRGRAGRADSFSSLSPLPVNSAGSKLSG